MSHILIINGYQTYGEPKGKLNETLADEMERLLKGKHEIKRTNIDKGYKISDEQEKFVWADTIIFQTPVYWFNVPGLLKTYIDEVYRSGIFFSGRGEYGRGGLFKDKHYMLSTTWNAPREAFQNETAFLGGKTVDDIFLGFHKTQEFVGMKKLETFTVHDVVHHPQIDIYLEELKKHLEITIK
ncbi:flavodoxin family protein [Terrilactibacillus sp. BCM23-1]|uniref:Flavodoxin family protein n=1 Tax=Terrilactibacillus tamarindi TaxID=2599694 RepID=A0A6N8CLP8_9BACI|nr:NAD(P)H-dependent oxidoreductase [Terrilactibacillus tamarindi]MTT30478.1 flavodoxin family protein [Terrilactibacillus tamarindi]